MAEHFPDQCCFQASQADFNTFFDQCTLIRVEMPGFIARHITFTGGWHIAGFRAYRRDILEGIGRLRCAPFGLKCGQYPLSIVFNTARNIFSTDVWICELHHHWSGRGRIHPFKRIETFTGQHALQFTLRRCTVSHDNKIFPWEGCTSFHVSLLNTHQNWLKEKSAGEQ
ncbi:hypothetical protein PS681_06137 [Pseudomonas fluorescens]|nr:hypothetical protein PS681_06137 [Pseudomonas fluorescens]